MCVSHHIDGWWVWGWLAAKMSTNHGTHTAPKAWSNGCHKGADTLQPNTVWSSKATQPHCSLTQQCGTGVVPTPYKCTKATTKHTNNATKAQGVMGCVVAHTRVGDKGCCLVGVSCLTNTTLPTLWLLVGWQAECTHSKAQPSMSTMQPMWWHKQRQRGTKALTQHTTSWCCCSASHHQHHHGCTALHCTK